MVENNCEFCDKNSINKQIIFQNNLVIVLYPLRPTIPENVMVIPARHAQALADLSEEEVLEINKVINNIYACFKAKKNATGFNIFANVGVKAGQHIPHFHWHIFIRFDDEKISPYKIMNDPSLKEEITPEVWEERRDSISSILRN